MNKVSLSRLFLHIGLSLVLLGLSYSFFITPPSAEAAPLCVNTTGTGGCYTDLATAVAAASSGDTISIDAGTYATTGSQLVIDKNLTISGAGAGSTVIVPGGSTGSSGDARGWFLITSGTFNLSNLTLDGSGFSIHQAMRFNGGSGSVSNITIQNIVYSKYIGFGIASYSNVSVTGSTFQNIERVGVIFFGTGVTNAIYSGNTYVGNGAGDYVNYGVEFGGGAVGTVSGSSFSNIYGVAVSDGSESGGILATTYYGGGTSATITGNAFENNSYGIIVGYDTADTSTANASNNCFINNSILGFASNGASGLTLNGANNWWNSATGPVVDGTNGVSPDVPFTPFLTAAPAFCGGPVAGNTGDFPNIGMVKISVEQAQPAYDSAGGSIIRHNGGHELWLPHDYDSNGFDTYVVTETMMVDGRLWVGMWLGSQTYGWVPIDMVTIIYDPS